MCLTYNYFIEERLRLRQAAKKKSLHQQEREEAALQYGERLVASCGQDQVHLEQGCGEDHLEVESSLLWQVGDKDAAERAVQVSTVKYKSIKYTGLSQTCYTFAGSLWRVLFPACLAITVIIFSWLRHARLPSPGFSSTSAFGSDYSKSKSDGAYNAKSGPPQVIILKVYFVKICCP